MTADTDTRRYPVANTAHLLMGLFAMLWLLAPQSVSAHATLVSTTPVDGEQLAESPTVIELQFSEPLGIVDGGTVLHGSDMEPLPLTAETQDARIVIPIVDSLADGSYILQWRVISADGHPITGTVSFTVGESGSAVSLSIASPLPAWIEWLRSAAVAVKYMGLLGAFGVLVVGWRLIPGDVANLHSLGSGLAAIGLFGVVAELPLSGMILRGEAVPVSAILDLPTGNIVAAAVSISAITIFIAMHNRISNLVLTSLLMLLPLLALLLDGHTRSREPIWVMMTSDAVHVISGAIWLGGIILLTLGLSGRWRGEGFASEAARLRTVSGFSALAIYTAVAVVFSGALMAFTILEEFKALYRSTWGQALLIKIGLVSVVLMLAAANRYWIIPRHQPGSAGSIRWLQRLVGAELVVLLAIAGVSGSLVHQNPTNQAESGSTSTILDESIQLDADHSIAVRITVEPDSVLSVEAQIVDAEGQVIVPDGDVELAWYLPEQKLGPVSLTLADDPETGMHVGEIALPISGDWELEVTAGIDRFTDSRGTVIVQIP